MIIFTVKSANSAIKKMLFSISIVINVMYAQMEIHIFSIVISVKNAYNIMEIKDLYFIVMIAKDVLLQTRRNTFIALSVLCVLRDLNNTAFIAKIAKTAIMELKKIFNFVQIVICAIKNQKIIYFIALSA